MAGYGLRIRDASGNVTVDISTKLPRLIYQWEINNAILSNDAHDYFYYYTSPAVPGLANDGTWFIYSPFAYRMTWLGNQVRVLLYSSSNSRVVISFFKVG